MLSRPHWLKVYHGHRLARDASAVRGFGLAVWDRIGVPRTEFTLAQVEEWLQTTGGPLEMRVARAMMLRGLVCEQSRYYVDPDDPRKAREVDVVAIGTKRVTNGSRAAVLELLAVIECKHAPTPWVLYRPGRGRFGTMPFLDRVTTEYGQHWLDVAGEDLNIVDLPLWHLEDGPGYSLTTIKMPPGDGGQPQDASGARSGAHTKKGSRGQQRQFGGERDLAADLAYRALYGVTKATLSIAQQLSHQSEITRLSVLFPVIVISGQLFEAYLDGDSLVVNEVQRGKIHWSHPASANGRVLVDVVTEQSLDLFADHFRDAVGRALQHGDSAAQAALRHRPAAVPFRFR